MKTLILFATILFFTACSTKDFKPEKSIRLKSYLLHYEGNKQIRNFWNSYTYDAQNRLTRIVQNDTTYNLISQQYNPVLTTTEYIYGEDGFLINRMRSHLSVAQSWNRNTSYQYNTEGLLSLEDRGSTIVEYRYDDLGKLKSTITSTLWNGQKNVIDYNDEVPSRLFKNSAGYFVEETDENTFFDNNLNITKIERFDAGKLIYEKNISYSEGLIPLLALPDFNGFPKIKSFSYRQGIENSIEVYTLANGQPQLTDERKMIATQNSRGYIMRSTGIDRFNIGTNLSGTENIDFQFNYEEY